jgi:hypothetical protein
VRKNVKLQMCSFQSAFIISGYFSGLHLLVGNLH